MISIDVRADIKQAQVFLKSVDRGVKSKAVPRALNKTATTVRKTTAQDIQQRRNLKIGVIKSAMRIRRATARYPTASIVVSGRPISIRHFANAGVRGVTVKILKREKPKRLVKHGHKAFINPKWRPGVFVRTNRRMRNPPKNNPNRQAIQKWAPVPGLPRVLVQPRILASIKRVVGVTFPKRMREELNFEINKAKIRARGR